jgi:transposase
VQIKIRLGNDTRQQLCVRLQQAYATGSLRLVRRIHALLYIADDEPVTDVAKVLGIGEQTIRDYVGAFLLRGIASLTYKRLPGRPPKLSKTQRKELADLIKAGPQAAGYEAGCWSALMIQDLILRHFGIEYHPHYICTLLHNMDFSFQKARFISDHLNEAARIQWITQTWPKVLRMAHKRKAMILFGDEASFAQWGSLSYTWAPRGQQPTVKTSGKRKGYKVFGLIDYFCGRFFYKAQTGRFNSESYACFLLEVLTQTNEHLILIQDGAKYHTSKAMSQFFAEHKDRLTKFQLPSYSPDFNPIEYLWKKVKKQATHLKYFAEFTSLIEKVDQALVRFANAPKEIMALMGRYCESLGAAAA